jgi:hypothetical protein
MASMPFAIPKEATSEAPVARATALRLGPFFIATYLIPG